MSEADSSSTWSPTLPTQPGWYWFATGSDVPPTGLEWWSTVEMMYVFLHEDIHALVSIQGVRCRHGARTSFPLELLLGVGYWSGPLEPPDIPLNDAAVPVQPRARARQEL